MARVVDTLSKEGYDQFRLEAWVKEFWSRERVYEKARDKSRRSPRKFYFLDGPPYASAKSIHVGTAWNKVIKDVVLRYHRMMGFNVWDQPGYDTHGLPIEVKIERKLGVKTKKEIEERIGVDRFVMECKAFVDENMKAMTENFKEIGVWMDWDNPYVTYRDEYIESGWWLIKRAHEKGLLYRDVLVHHWCPRCETTLAGYEVSEYVDLEDPSIYVKFPVKGREGEYLLIWTTTPWTLPANAFVMAHPDFMYARVRVGDETLIMARARVERVMKEAGVEDYEIVEEFPGSSLEGLEYTHPLEDVVDAQKILAKYHRVVLAPEAVTAHEGTGLVHSAPGHGDVDFEINKSRVGAPIVSLVDDQGRMTRDAGKYSGLYFRTEANQEIIRDLKDRGALFHESRIVHKYPVCWRCKTPLVLRATRQWFIKVSALKNELIREAEKVFWQPSWAKTRSLNLLKEVRDWVISRQRYWGIPLPVWTCTSCGYTHVVGSVRELEELGGSRPENLHRPWVDRVELKCPKCGGVMRRVPDVLDVWFDSGIAFYASLGYPQRRDLWEGMKPVDFIVEGHDQIRGWFFSLLRTGVIGFGEVPYRRVLVHGFALDEHGREMHKSLGNYIDFQELISRMPRDVVRLWVMQTTVWEDLRFSWRGMQEMHRAFNVIWNTFSFASLYMGLDGFDPAETSLESVEDALQEEDKWLLSRLAGLVEDYHEAMRDLRPHDAARRLKEFIVDDVSHWYIRLVRRRVWEEEDTPEKLAAYTALYTALKTWLLLAAPFTPYTSEYLYQKLVRPAEPEAPLSVHLNDMPEDFKKWRDPELEADMEVAKKIVEAAAAARSAAGLKLRRPVRTLLVSPKRPEVAEAVRRMERVIREMANAKSIEIVDVGYFEEAKVYSAEPDYGEIGPEYKKLTKRIVELLEERGGEVARSIIENGYYEADIDGNKVRLEKRHVNIKAVYPDWLSVKETDLGIVAVDTRLSREEILEGLAREVVRRIQAMRKEMNLPVDAHIKVYISGDGEILEAVRELADYVKAETRSVEILFEEPPGGAYTREWEVDEKRVKIGVARAS